MNIDYSLMNEYQHLLINEYCQDNLKELKKLCWNIWGKKGIASCFYDDLYDDAIKVLSESVMTYDSNANVPFRNYLMKNIRLSYREWVRNTFYRAKRNNLLLDKNGLIQKDENMNPIIIPNVSFDASAEDDLDLREKIASDFSIENEIFHDDMISDENVDIFFKSLSKLEQQILRLKMQDYSVKEILSRLNISDREYKNAMKSITKNENLSLFSKNINDGDYMEELRMSETVMEINSADSYRTDKYSLYSLLEDKKNGDINCRYILQRKPFQWTNEEVNRYLCRILSGLPIPEIIICEQTIRSILVSYLIDGLQRLSYAEAFKEGHITIGQLGAERHLIEYRDYVKDENGERVFDEYGLPIFEIKVCDVIGKKYKDLPDELKKRFNNFNINVTKFFNCTDQQIADHIRDYNNHAGMNKEQGGLTKISTDAAMKIKNISDKNSFFKNCGKFTDSNRTKGKLERVVAESLMLMFYRNDWKSNLDKIYQHINENVTDNQFDTLNTRLNDLASVISDDKKVNSLFTITTTPMWMAVFNEFSKYDIDSSRFVEFLNAYIDELKDKEIDGVSMNSFEHKQTKQKTTITGKIDLIVKLMKEYLHIEENEPITKEEFISETVDLSIEEVKNDMDLYEDSLDDLENETIKDGSKLLDDENRLSLLAMIAYSYKNDIDLEEWLEQYAKNNNTYILDQKNNFLHMQQDLHQYRQRIGVM